MKRTWRIKNDERGFSMVFVALGFMGFLAASMLAIDVGMLMTARNQAQNSADAGALAGATALAYNDFDDRTPSGPAVMNALAGARGNKVMSANVAVEAADVTFPNDPDGYPTRVKVNVFRNAARGNPMQTFIAKYFGIVDVGVNATATAEASSADSMTCVKPFTIPDRWLEGGTRPSTEEDAWGTGDVYRGPDDPNPTGYNYKTDVGLELTLKADNGSKIAPSFYYPYAVPGSRGASDYRWNIGYCNTTVMTFGQQYQSEPGNMVGPTSQGMADLIDRDPNAHWDPVQNKVIGSSAAISPRVVAIPLFDPVYYFSNKQNSRNASLKFVNYMGFFIEEMRGNEVVGRITPIGGLSQGGLPTPSGAFPRVIRLVQ